MSFLVFVLRFGPWTEGFTGGSVLETGTLTGIVPRRYPGRDPTPNLPDYLRSKCT